jgi:hypothetical protein
MSGDTYELLVITEVSRIPYSSFFFFFFGSFIASSVEGGVIFAPCSVNLITLGLCLLSVMMFIH